MDALTILDFGQFDRAFRGRASLRQLYHPDSDPRRSLSQLVVGTGRIILPVLCSVHGPPRKRGARLTKR
ncbi:hypothetical protein KC328_g113 [Hortaea werneckii]|nr:hypothetical protein KC328_g113 [Hortaea werneckii]